MKKILVLNYEFPPLGGGGSSVSYEIANRLSMGGDFDIDVVTMAFKGLPKYEKINNNFKVHRVKCLRSKKEICHPWEQMTYLISGWFKSKKLVKKNKYDICHCHFVIPTGILALRLKKKFGLDYILTAHGSDIPGHNIDRFKFLHKFTGLVLRKVCINAKKITTPSIFLKKLILKNIGKFLEKKIFVLPNGSYDFRIKGIIKKNIILSVGRIYKGKGFQYLIKAFNNINNKDWKLYIVGDGPYKSNLEKLSKGKDNIIFSGWLDNKGEEFLNLINRAKIFSLLSSFESQGIVLVEAMSSGWAILASNNSACIETVSNNVGFRVQWNNNNEIIYFLKKLMDNNRQTEIFMNQSRKRYKDKYNWEKIIKKYKEYL